MSSKQIQQIYQYIQNHGNYLSSDKVLKQIDKHSDLIWMVFVKLCNTVRNTNFQDVYRNLTYVIDTGEKHQRSVKWLRQFMQLREVASKVQMDYLISDYIKPQKQKLITLMHKIVQILKQTDKMKQQLDEDLVRRDLVTKQLQKTNKISQQTLNRLEQLKIRKANELPLYQTKLHKYQQLQKQTGATRQQKLKILTEKKQLEDKLEEKEKQLEKFKYQLQSGATEIIQLKKQIARNVPTVKRDFQQIQQKFQLAEKQYTLQQQVKKQKQRLALEEVRKRNSFFQGILRNAKTINEMLSSLSQSKSVRDKLREQHQKQLRTKNELLKKQSSLFESQMQLEIEQTAGLKRYDTTSKLIEKYNLTLIEKRATLEEVQQSGKLITKNIDDLRIYYQRTLSYVKQLQQRIQQGFDHSLKQYQQFIKSSYEMADQFFEPNQKMLEELKKY